MLTNCPICNSLLKKEILYNEVVLTCTYWLISYFHTYVHYFDFKNNSVAERIDVSSDNLEVSIYKELNLQNNTFEHFYYYNDADNAIATLQSFYESLYKAFLSKNLLEIKKHFLLL